ncbi:MAG TPA: DUF1365 family protein [Nocardioides sp.]|nr:DUF1365 family protein [Nocardioides sp.]
MHRTAVIGSGVSGLAAAHFASRSAHVTLYEADDRLGGHADTHEVREGSRTLAIDTGFIVHNPRTYPVLLRLFDELGVATQPSEMSMSIRDDGTGLEWAGALGLGGLVPTARTLGHGRYLRMLAEIPRFHRRARALLAGPDDDRTLRRFLADGDFTAYFERHFMEPLVAAVWSCDPDVALDYPARYLFTFLEHHGMLGIFGSPEWRTVTGGSRQYVDRLAAALPDVRTGCKVTSIAETSDGVQVTDGNGRVASYDGVVVATHPDQALSMLAEPTPAQREVLSALPYSENVALLHTDTSVLPSARRAWASWNFRRPSEPSDGVVVTYDLTRLQRLDTETRYLVTLGGEGLVDPDAVIERMEYAHPLYTPESVAAQRRLPEIDTDRIAFAGAYHGWGFHEDGARSGLAAVERLGQGSGGFEAQALAAFAPQPPTTVVEVRGAPATSLETVATPRIYRTTITHTRRTPFTRRFTHRSHTWVVDLDDLPDHRLLGRFEARDHLGDPERTIRDNLEAFLADHDVALDGGRVLMAAHPRAFGHCFNPISVFWCWDRQGRPAATVVEVHNTYGDRHAYLLHPDAHGRATTLKEMYVSPFHGTDGHYELAVPAPDDRLRLAVTLHSDDGATFTASLAGRRTDTGPWRAALASLRGALLIRMHGIRLWLRGLRVRPRPRHRQEGVR